MWQCKNILYTTICFYTGTTPSWAETQPWSFVVVESTAVKGKVLLVDVSMIVFNISRLRAFSSAFVAVYFDAKYFKRYLVSGRGEVYLIIHPRSMQTLISMFFLFCSPCSTYYKKNIKIKVCFDLEQ